MPLKNIDHIGPPLNVSISLSRYFSSGCLYFKNGAPLPPVKMPRMVTLPWPFDEFLMASLGFLACKRETQRNFNEDIVFKRSQGFRDGGMKKKNSLLYHQLCPSFNLT